MEDLDNKPYFTFTAVLMTIVLTFAIGEIVIRIYNRTENRLRPIWIPDPYPGMVHSPNNRFQIQSPIISIEKSCIVRSMLAKGIFSISNIADFLRKT